MMKIYRTQDKQLTRVDDMNEGAWICLTNPTDDEVRRVAATLDIEPADIVAATDPEESARISLEDGYTVIIVDIPVKVDGAGEGIYTTIPLGILLTQELIVTVCSTDTAVIGDFAACRVKEFSTRKKMRFVYQLLYRAATMYQQELRLIDRRRQAIEKNLAGELKDSDLMELHGLESTLVYFATSLRANATVLDRLTRYKRLEQYPDDRELLDDVIVEIRQAIEMTSIYRDDIKGTRELFSSILDNRLNNAMKYLTSITLLMAVPTVISGLYGMNVQSDGMPFANTTAGFAIVLGLTLALCVFCGVGAAQEAHVVSYTGRAMPAPTEVCPSADFFCNISAKKSPTLYKGIKEAETMEDAAIVALYWARDEQALAETAALSSARTAARSPTTSCTAPTTPKNAKTTPGWPPGTVCRTNRPARLAPYLGRITRNLALDRL